MRKQLGLAVAGVLILLLACSAFGQNISGVITGTIVDSGGAVIPNAQITLTNQETRAVQTLRSNEAGIFVFSSVLPGTYTGRNIGCRIPVLPGAGHIGEHERAPHAR